MRIWLDDQRKPLPGFTHWVKDDCDAFIQLACVHAPLVTALSCDHDLGHAQNGLQLLTAVEERVFHGLQFPMLETVTVHSANGAAWSAMLASAENIISRCGSSQVAQQPVYLIQYEQAIKDHCDVWVDKQYDDRASLMNRCHFRRTPFSGVLM